MKIVIKTRTPAPTPTIIVKSIVFLSLSSSSFDSFGEKPIMNEVKWFVLAVIKSVPFPLSTISKFWPLICHSVVSPWLRNKRAKSSLFPLKKNKFPK